MISFTGNGRRLERSLAHELEKEGHQVLQAVKCKELESDKDAVKCSAREWTGEQFRTRDVLIFIGAVQIAVGLIASFIGSKTTDPAVLVLDEKGQYCIPILSGHIGGANEMAERIAEMAGALPVITTATDIRGKWAIDVFARKNHLYIEDMQKAKQISAKILEGKTVVAAIESGRDSIEGTVPEEVKIVQETYENPDIYIGIYERKLSSHVLRMIPQRITVGIGCRRGTSAEQIEQLVDKILKESHINKKSIGRIASIDLKKDEEGLLTFCNKYNIEPEFYPAEELKKVEGEFSVSTFVKKVTGVDNVCERAVKYYLKDEKDGKIIQELYTEIKNSFNQEVQEISFEQPFQLKTTLNKESSLNLGGFKIDIQDDCLHLNREEVSIQANKVCNDVVSPKLEGNYDLEIYYDHHVFEIYINGGEYVMSQVVYDLNDQVVIQNTEYKVYVRSL